MLQSTYKSLLDQVGLFQKIQQMSQQIRQEKSTSPIPPPQFDIDNYL